MMPTERQANYVIVEEPFNSAPGERIVIRDVGPWDAHPTITNDAENVVKQLYADGRVVDGMTLLYYDSEGVLDEITHAGGAFTGFAPGEDDVKGGW
jgi:hypothetical protein